MKRICLETLLVATAIFAAICGPVSAQSSSNVIANFDSTSQVVSGDWNKRNGELIVGNARGSRVVFAEAVPEDYALTLEFTRTAGDNAVGVILPVGASQCAFILSAFNGEAHGIGLVDGKLARDNPTTIRPGNLETDHPYRLLIEVDVNGDSASIKSTLDGRPFLQWRGDPKSLTMLDIWRLPSRKNVGLCTYAETTFHSITINQLDPTMRMTGNAVSTTLKPVAPAKAIVFEERKWAAPQSESVVVENFKGKRALHINGGEDNFVFLPRVEFGDGTIEVDIASGTFSGIGFRGDAAGKTVEKLYFRPFNSGTRKHKNTVQYAMLGKPDFGWRSLRDSAPGKYESGADIKVNEWFHVRIVIEQQRLAAYVNDGRDPVLVVDELLGDGKIGTIGVWGWDSYFANFRFTPAK